MMKTKAKEWERKPFFKDLVYRLAPCSLLQVAIS
jgi:hypothetical protein